MLRSAVVAITLVIALAAGSVVTTPLETAAQSDYLARLWALVPASLEGTCELLEQEKGDALVPSEAALDCMSGVDPDIDDVGLFLFANERSLQRWWDQRTKRIARETGVSLGPGDCAADIQGIEEIPTGSLICYRQSGDARVRWIDTEHLLYGSLDTHRFAISWANDWWQRNIADEASTPPSQDGGAMTQASAETVDAGDTGPRLPERAFTSTWIGTGPDDHTTSLSAKDVDGARLYLWDVDGDGSEDLLDQTVTYTFDSPGEHQVTLIVQYEDGREEQRATMTIVVNPAVTFAPLVYLHPEEVYWPMSAQAFIENADLWWSYDDECSDGAGELVDASPDAALLASGGYDHQVRDAESCDLLGPPFTTAQYTRPNDSHSDVAAVGSSQGFHLDLDDPWRPGEPLHKAPVYYEYEPGEYLIYWFLYGYNEHEFEVPGVGPVGNRHEGDWEHIALQLDEVDQATLFAFYQHDCDPVVLNRLEMGGGFGPDAQLDDGTHPVVYSALGSHASYWQPIEQGVVDTVSGELRDRLSRISGTAGEDMCWRKDTATAGVPWQTWENLVDARDPEQADWYGYGGAWGPPGPDDPALGRVNDGPLGPSEHKLASATPGWVGAGGEDGRPEAGTNEASAVRPRSSPSAPSPGTAAPQVTHEPSVATPEPTPQPPAFEFEGMSVAQLPYGKARRGSWCAEDRGQIPEGYRRVDVPFMATNMTDLTLGPSWNPETLYARLTTTDGYEYPDDPDEMVRQCFGLGPLLPGGTGLLMFQFDIPSGALPSTIYVQEDPRNTYGSPKEYYESWTLPLAGDISTPFSIPVMPPPVTTALGLPQQVGDLTVTVDGVSVAPRCEENWGGGDDDGRYVLTLKGAATNNGGHTQHLTGDLYLLPASGGAFGTNYGGQRMVSVPPGMTKRFARELDLSYMGRTFSWTDCDGRPPRLAKTYPWRLAILTYEEKGEEIPGGQLVLDVGSPTVR